MSGNINGNPQQFNIQPMQPGQQLPQASQDGSVQPEQANVPQTPVVSADQAMAAQGMAQVNMPPVQVTPSEDTAMVAAKNPAVINQSDVLFRAAMDAGLSYPEAATFATNEVR